VVEGKPAPTSCLVNAAMGLVCRNHSQIRGTKAELADSHDAMMDEFEITSITSEENEENQPQLANNE